MLLHIPQLLLPEELAQVRRLIDTGPWTDGKVTAGLQSASAKRNQQLPKDCREALAAGAIIRGALDRSAAFFAAALPRRIVPPLFNRYAGGMDFGNHIDNSVRFVNRELSVRTDLSATVFLADPTSYEGGELVIEDSFGTREVKLAAGDMVLYPGTSVHRVEPVTRGARLASFFWIESMVRRQDQRSLLWELDQATSEVRRRHGEDELAVSLTGCYHNLLRMWADC